MRYYGYTEKSVLHTGRRLTRLHVIFTSLQLLPGNYRWFVAAVLDGLDCETLINGTKISDLH